MKRKIHIGILALLLGALVVMAAVADLGLTAKADTNAFTFEIGNFDDLMDFVALSKNENFCEPYQWTIRLTSDINITEQNLKDLKNGVYHSNGEVIKSVTVGCRDKKFSGIFDGQGHTIKGLYYDGGELGYASDIGLFSYTDGAVIKNLVIEGANLQADYRGGIVAGSADNTTFENITVIDSKIRVSCSNNVLTLVTDGGLVGGAIVGEAVNCVLYNCESNNTTVNNNNTAGVSALGGKGLYLGGLVGTADKGTLIEYSRVIDGQIRSHYDVAVGALGGNTIYVGGIVGQMKAGSKVMDSFCTADLYFYVATYVSVGSGNSGHIGGIAGAAYGSNCEIERCHFAGSTVKNEESKQWNSVIAIPIIQKDINLYGLIDKVPDKVTVKECYYRESTANSEAPLGDNNLNGTSTGYGAKDDETYINRSFWESEGYDFVGNISRSTAYSSNHANKWVMDYERGIPVHGYSAAATFDFPGAGSVTIGATTLVENPVTTDNPYIFAVQGMNPRVVSPSLELSIELSEGYHFYGWYKVSDYLEFMVNNIKELETIAHSTGSLVSTEQTETVFMEDNDLFVACVKAEVMFHDLNGSEMTEYTRDYTYKESLADVVPKTTPDGAKFYGWTTVPSTEEGGGYSAITYVQLSALESAGKLYFAGDEVTETLKLYPIYTSYITNIKTVFEGNEQDASDDTTLRIGVGETKVGIDENGNVYIEAVAEDNATDFPDGYRFLGWYQTLEDGTEVLVSTDTEYNVPDLTKEVTYTARFEYRVDYYSENKDDVSSTIDKSPYASIWHKYKETFQYLKDVPLDGEDSFSHWATSKNEDECSSCSNQIAEDYQVISPMSAYAHITGKSSYDVLLSSDFPGASVLSDINAPSNTKYTVSCVPYDGYKFIFWACEAENGGTWTSEDSDWVVGYHITTRSYHYEAHLSAYIKFYNKLGDNFSTVTRHYNESILHTGVTHTYAYPMSGSAVSYADTSDASPENSVMEQTGYAFLGWISDTEVAVGSDEWNYIYDVDGDAYCTSDPDKVQAYLISTEDVVTETMDLYPVYAKYNVKTTTNIADAVLPDGVNKPGKPTYVPATITVTDTTKKGNAAITLTAEHNVTNVVDGQEQKYQLIGFTCEADGVVTDIFANGTMSSDGLSYTFTTDVQAGNAYLFTAIYEPIVVVYHLDNVNNEMVIRNTGDILGVQPEPNYGNISGLGNVYYLMGWTNEKPATENSQWIFNTIADYSNSGLLILTSTTVVEKSMDLYPVFVKSGLTVNSNIDEVISGSGNTPDTVRYIKQTGKNSYALVAEEYIGYKFLGWKKDSSNDYYSPESYYPLSDDEFFQTGTFTAIYEKIEGAVQVRYHDLEGNVIYVAAVLPNERTFMTTDTVDKVVVNETTKEEEIQQVEVTVPIDMEAFVNIENTLKENQTFITWEWLNGSEYVSWDAFKDTPISGNMDIYPVVYEVAFEDTSQNDYTDKMDYGFYVGSENEDILNSIFKEAYAQAFLKITIKELTHQTSTGKGIKDVVTSVYNQFENYNGDIIYEVASEGSVNTDGNGIAIHYFSGHLIIEKVYKNAAGEIDTTIDDIIIINVKNESGAVLSIPIQVTKGEGMAKIKLPAGTYTVEEDTVWSWRDTLSTVEEYVENNGETSLANVQDGKVVVANFGSKQVFFTNQRTNRRWLSDIERIANVFKIETN